jgi:hypothetical protein
MTRALVRRACGHLQAVCVFGNSDRWIDQAIRKKERDICGICRARQKADISGEQKRQGDGEKVEVVLCAESGQLSTREEK